MDSDFDIVAEIPQEEEKKKGRQIFTVYPGKEYQIARIFTGRSPRGDWQCIRIKNCEIAIYPPKPMDGIARGDFIVLDEIISVGMSWKKRYNASLKKDVRFANLHCTANVRKTKTGILDDIENYDNIDETGLTGELPF